MFLVFGFRFSDTQNDLFCQLFAIGYDWITPAHTYHWDGLKRIDGPLCLFQYTVSGKGMLEAGGITHSIQKGQAILVDIPGDHRYYLPEASSHWAFYFILFCSVLLLFKQTGTKSHKSSVPLLFFHLIVRLFSYCSMHTRQPSKNKLQTAFALRLLSISL